MWIDFVVIAISFILLFIMNFLAKRIKKEISWAEECEDNKKAAKIYRITYILIQVMSFIFCGVLAYVYVFQ